MPNASTAASSTTVNDAIADKVKAALRQQLLARDKAAQAPAPAPVVEPEPKPDPIVLGSGQVLFTTLIGKPLPNGLRDFAVTVYDKAAMSPELTNFVPSVSPTYNVQVEEAHALLMSWEMNEKVLITGPTGSGKSTLVAHCCALTNRPMLRVNMTGDIESSTLFGQLVVENGGTVWKDGPITEAVRYGAVCCIDEWDVTPPEILFGMQWLLEENGKLFLKEAPGDAASKFLTPHDNFRLVCLGNTVGQGDDHGHYSGTNVQNNASIDRFQTTIVLDYLEPAHEIKIITDAHKGIKAQQAQKMVSFANLVRSACKTGSINLTMSPRTLVNWGKKIVAYKDTGYALRLSFMNKLRDTDRAIVAEMFTKVFGEKLRG